MAVRGASGWLFPRAFSESLSSQRSLHGDRGVASGDKVYNGCVIALAQLGMHFLTFLFFVGLAGSSIVVVLSFIEDLTELLEE